MAAEPPAAGPPRVSIWAVLSLLSGVAVLCPIASLLAPILGVVALVGIRRRADRRGAGLALAGIVLGLAASAGWAGTARWWHVNARVPMMRGPIEALAAGQAGDLERFRAGFAPDGPAPPPAEAAAFLDEVGGRYGRLLGSQQRAPQPPAAADDPGVDTRRPRIPYTFLFEAGPVDGEAEFVIRDDAAGLVFKFAWVALRDPELGDLVYPASASGRVGYDPVPPPEPAP